MKYFKGSLVAGEDREKWPTCDFCGKKYRFMAITEEYKKACNDCERNDKEHEYSEKEYGWEKRNENR